MPRKKKVVDEVPLRGEEKAFEKNVREEFDLEDDNAPFAPIPNTPAPLPALTREKVIPAVAPLVKPAESIPAETENPYYHKTLWHGVKPVFQCHTCGVFRADEDGMIVHVLIHAPRLEQSNLLDKLIKEKK